MVCIMWCCLFLVLNCSYVLFIDSPTPQNTFFLYFLYLTFHDWPQALKNQTSSANDPRAEVHERRQVRQTSQGKTVGSAITSAVVDY